MAIPVVARMVPTDLDHIMMIERQSFKQPWSRHMYLVDLQQNPLATYLVLRPSAEDEALLPRVLAYGGFWLMVDEAHIATVASHPDWRGCGLGKQIMLGLIAEAIQRGAERATLEVRVSNAPARQLYDALGFGVAGVRTRYYQDGEDAIIMTTTPLREPEMQKRLAFHQSAVLSRLNACFAPVKP